MHKHSLLSSSASSCLGLLILAAGVVAAPPPAAKPKEVPLADRIRTPMEADRPLTDKLRSPRETLRTLYFSVLTYDLFPQMIADAVACLDLDSLQPRPNDDDAAMLALDLEYILQSLALPLSGAPEQSAGTRFILYDADGFLLAMRRGPDGGWRFDLETLEKLPAMLRTARERKRKRAALDVSGLREGFTDPRATLRQFISDVVRNDFYAAARALDLGALSGEERRSQGPVLAQQLAFVLQHRGFMFRQEVPQQPDGPTYTWHADRNGRIALERGRQADGKDAWLFTRQTVRNIPRMYEAVRSAPADPRYVRLGLVVPAVGAGGSAVQKRPEEVPAHLGSPRALLQGFFRSMDGADRNDAKLADALEYLDLAGIPATDRVSRGGKLAVKLEGVLRRLPLELNAIPDDWNAPPQLLGEAQGVRVEIVRQRDGRWCFSDATVARVPEMFDKVAGKARPEAGRAAQLDSARDTLVTFRAAVGRRDYAQAARCLNLGNLPLAAQDDLGPVLAFKLQYVLERTGHIYIQEVPDNPEGPRYVLYRGELGHITLDRKADEPNKGQWLFTPWTVENVEPMFRALLGQPAEDGEPTSVPCFRDAPGAWLRLNLPDWAQTPVGPLDLYQWLGLALVLAASWLGAWLTVTVSGRLLAWLLRRFGSSVSGRFVSRSLRPLTALAAVWTFFVLLQGLDLSLSFGAPVFAAERFLLAALLGWLGLRLMDLTMAVYTNTELLRPHRSLGDMIVPVSMRLGKAVVLLTVATYVIYQIGEVDLLGRFLTGLGVAGLAASLSAQDALKNYFGTLLLIGERAFKIGDRIRVGDKEGIVEQVGFRSTRLRTDDASQLTIPNAVIAASPIDNKGVRSPQRLSLSVALSADVPLKRLIDLRDRLQAWLAGQPSVVRDKTEVRAGQVESGVGLSVSLTLAADADEASFRASLSGEVLHVARELEVGIAPADRATLWRDAGAAVPEESAPPVSPAA